MSDIKYLADGQRCTVLATLPDGKFLVAGQVGTGCDDDDAWFDTDHPQIVERVFDEPPIAVYETRVAELLVQVEQLEGAKSALQAKIAGAERAHKERLAKLAKYTGLERIEDFIDGKITHLVVSESYYHMDDAHYRLRITTPQAERSGDEARNTELKLLALYGKSDRTVEWRLNYYSDGSGNRWSWCWPFTSLDEAQVFARKLFDQACVKAEPKKQYPESLNHTAKAIGAAVPGWVEVALRQQRMQSANKELLDAQKALDLANAKLAALQS